MGIHEGRPYAVPVMGTREGCPYASSSFLFPLSSLLAPLPSYLLTSGK